MDALTETFRGGQRPPRVAIVHDWLYVLGGAERVLAAILRCYPDADVFCVFDVLDEEDHRTLGFERSNTTFLQRMPFIRTRHRMYLPLMPVAVEQLDLRGYDLVLSSSYAVAKGVLTGPDQLHISYVHSPMRYAWDLQHKYLEESRLDKGVRSMLARVLLHRMRVWDQRTAHGVDAYLANSHFVARRIRKIYGRDATVIHPPVDVPSPYSPRPRENFFLTASRLVAYKNIRAIVEAFRLLPDEQLVVVGEGPEAATLHEIASPNVTFAGFVSDDRLRALMGAARAFIFAAEEDFGIVPLEAQAEGTPVLALGKGGARETIVVNGPARTGMFFEAAEAEPIAEVVREFAAAESEFSPELCYRNAARFSRDRFCQELSAFVEQELRAFRSRLDESDARSPLYRVA